MTAALALAVLVVEVAGGAAWGLGSWRSSPTRLQGDATWAVGMRPAPDFRLFDQNGHTVTLASERGRTVVLAFLYSHCRELCPTVGAEFAQVQRSLPTAEQPQLVVVSVDPGGDTPTSVRAFAANEGWNGHWRWLLGTRTELAPVWRAYGIQVKPRRSDVAHSSAVYLIDSRGNERSGYIAPFLVPSMVGDLRTLSGPRSNARLVTLAAAGLLGLIAVGLLVLFTPWAVVARAWVERLLQRRRQIWAASAAIAVAAAAALLLRPASSAPQVVGALIPTAARRPALSLTDGAVLIRPRFALSARRGRVFYLNFWASWCIPCQQEAPAIRSFAQSLDPRQALFVGINTSDTRSDALAFIRRYRLTYPMLADTSQAISRRYALLGLPTTVVIDHHGRIALQLLGPQTTAQLRATLTRLTSR